MTTPTPMDAAQAALATAKSARDVDAILKAEEQIDALKKRNTVEREIHREKVDTEQAAALQKRKNAAAAELAPMLKAFREGNEVGEAILAIAKIYLGKIEQYNAISSLCGDLLGREPLTADYKPMWEVAYLLRAKLAGLPTRATATDFNAVPADTPFRDAVNAVFGEVRVASRNNPVLAQALKEAGL